MCKQPVLAFNCSRPLIYEGPHIGFQFHEGNSEFNSNNAIPTPIPIQMMAIPIQFQFRLNWVKQIPIPELDLELARKSNSGAELTPTLMSHRCCMKVRIETSTTNTKKVKTLYMR